MISQVCAVVGWRSKPLASSTVLVNSSYASSGTVCMSEHAYSSRRRTRSPSHALALRTTGRRSVKWAVKFT